MKKTKVHEINLFKMRAFRRPRHDYSIHTVYISNGI